MVGHIACVMLYKHTRHDQNPHQPGTLISSRGGHARVTTQLRTPKKNHTLAQLHHHKADTTPMLHSPIRSRDFAAYRGDAVTDRPNTASTQRTTYNLQPTTYNVQRTTYNVPITTYSLQRTEYIVPSTMYSSPPPAYQRHYLATLYPTQWVTHIVPDTMYSTQCAVPSLPTLQSTTDTTQCELTM
jgi:hypothetical protein